MQNLTRSDFETEALKSEIPVIVDFWAPWCGPCKMLDGALGKLAIECDGKIAIFKVDVSQEGELAQEWNVKGTPTLLLLKDGEETDRKVGGIPGSALKAWASAAVT